MKRIVCLEPGHLQMSEEREPKRKANEAIVQVKRVGICGTDLHAYRGNQHTSIIREFSVMSFPVSSRK